MANIDGGEHARGGSPPKKQRSEDGSLRGPSASRLGSNVPSERGTFPATSSDLTELRTAQPSVSLAPITRPPQPLSEDAMRRLGQGSFAQR